MEEPERRGQGYLRGGNGRGEEGEQGGKGKKHSHGLREDG